MDTELQAAQATIFEMLPWLGMTLDYTDKLAQALPDDLLDWRPEDPRGKFTFSLAEILMHCADSRSMFARQLAGNESEEGCWAEEPGEDSDIWKFKPHGGKQAIIDSLAASRAELAEWYNRSGSELLATTPGTRAVYDKFIASCKEKEQEIPAAVQARGPANIMRVMMACAVHESGHRGTLQAFMRLKGVEKSGFMEE